MKPQKQDEVRNDERPIQRTACSLVRSSASAASEHHEQTVILPAVVPGTPGEIEREDPRKQIATRNETAIESALPAR